MLDDDVAAKVSAAMVLTWGPSQYKDVVLPV